LATIEQPKHDGEILSAQAKHRAIQHGLEVPAPATATLPRSLLEKLAGALVDLIHARNLLKAVKTSDVPLKRLNAATAALKEVLAIAEKETAQPTQVKVLSVLVAYAAGHALALPQRYIMEVVDLFVDRGVRVETINNTQVLIKGKRVIPLVKLRSLLKLSEFPSMREDQVVVMRVGEAEFGLVIERVGELMEVVVDKLPRALRPLAIYQGTALANDEKLVMVMDTAGLARAIGFRQVQDIPPETAPQHMDRSLQGFLVFRAGTGVLKALLVDQVARIDEAASRAPDIRIATLPGTELPATGEYELVVLETGGEQVAIAVEKVLDVMHAPLALKPHGNNPAYLGTVELGAMTVELVNVANVIGARLMEAA
jgi:two-component system chemotaxis sensor kinase CheA